MTPRGIEPLLPPWKGGVLTAWPRSHIKFYVLFKWRLRRGSNPRPPAWQAGTLTNWATEPLWLWWLELESNQWHEDFQSSALPTELSSHLTSQRPTLPHSLPCSTIGAIDLNFPVRNGKKCYLYAIITRSLAPRRGLEPPTYRLTAECSTIELSRNVIFERILFFQNCI